MLNLRSCFQGFQVFRALGRFGDLSRCITTAYPHTDKSGDDYLKMILTSRVYDVAIETPLTYAPNLSTRLNCAVLLKREDLQPVFSFKIRGAYNKIASLPLDVQRKGIVTSSAGNHGQGVAFAAQQLKINAIICMPVGTPRIKVKAVQKQGGEFCQVVLKGETYDDAYTEAMRLHMEEGREFIHPFDDPLVIAGQGTVGMEIIKQIHSSDLKSRNLEAIFVCVGGGGLISGVAAFVKRVRPDIKIIGVEASDAAAMTLALKSGKIVPLEHVGVFADGAAVRQVGQETFRLCQRYVDEMMTVTTDEICAAIKDGFEDTRSILEPAGALALAGLKKYVKRQPGSHPSTFCAITSGANMNFTQLRYVSQRADEMEGLIAATIPERPGSFKELYDVIHPRNVTEFAYRLTDQKFLPPKQACTSSGYDSHRPTNEEHAHVFVSFQVSSQEEPNMIIERLTQKGFTATDLSDNEMAKIHGRYLVGGRARATDERLFRFEFPERPGALNNFLNKLHAGWNVSLFHYRNHGSDIGRVLVGIQVPDSDKEPFNEFLKDLGYAYFDETENSVYQQFLR